MAERKLKGFQQLVQAEMQETQNQEEYDVIYYALDLAPDVLVTKDFIGPPQVIYKRKRN